VTQHMNEISKKSVLRHPIDTLRVRFWYSFVKKKTGFKTAYQLELHFASNTKDDKKSPLKNIWHHYETGLHTPIKLVNLVDTIIPGSANLLNHPLWDVLKSFDPKDRNIKIWMEKLDPRVKLIISSYPHQRIDISKPPDPLSSKVARRLIKLSSLDALTAILLFWLQSQLHKQIKEAQFQATCMYNILLIIGLDSEYGREMVIELFKVFRSKVFDQTDWGYRLFDVDENLFEMSAIVLRLLSSREQDQSDPWDARCNKMFKIFEGRKGFDAQTCLKIFLRPNWHAGPPTQKQLADLDHEHLLWLWGWIYLTSGSKDLSFNDGLWTSLHELLSSNPIEFRMKVDSTRKSMTNFESLLARKDLYNW